MEALVTQSFDASPDHRPVPEAISAPAEIADPGPNSAGPELEPDPTERPIDKEKEEKELKAAIASCDEVNSGTSLFEGNEIRRAKTLEPAFRFCDLASRCSPDVLKKVLKETFVGPRNRAPSVKKLELFAVLRATRPEGDDQRKMCSDLAYMLKAAKLEGTAPDGFVEWATQNSLRTCRTKVRDSRPTRSSSSSGEGTPSDNTKEPTIAGALTKESLVDTEARIELKIIGQEAMTPFSISISEKASEQVEALISRSDPQLPHKILMAIAEVLEADHQL